MLTCTYRWCATDQCSQVYSVSRTYSDLPFRYAVWYGEAYWCDACSQGVEEVCDQGWDQPRVGGLPAAAYLPRWGERQARDPGKLVGVARGDPGSGTGLVDRPGIGCTRPGPGGDRLATAWARGRCARPSQGTRPAHTARAGRAGPGRRTGPDHRPGLSAGLEAGHDPL